VALTDSLVAYWSLDEASGTRVDATGRGNDLTPVGTPGSAAGTVGSAVDLSSGNSLSRASGADVSPGNVDFTLAFWVRFDAIPGAADVLGKWAGGGQLEYDVYLPGPFNHLQFICSTTGSDFPAVAAATFGLLSATTWYFVVAWHDAAANTLNIQVNNGAVDSAPHAGGVFQGSTALLLGGSNFGAPMDGRLDEVALWHRVLTSDERTALYNGGAGLAYAAVAAGATQSRKPAKRLALLGA
jgi:hypothetical protein